jgi:hypothetical protein
LYRDPKFVLQRKLDLDLNTDKHDDWNLVFAHHKEEDKMYPLTTIEIAEAQHKDQELKVQALLPPPLPTPSPLQTSTDAPMSVADPPQLRFGPQARSTRQRVSGPTQTQAAAAAALKLPSPPPCRSRSNNSAVAPCHFLCVEMG